MVNTSVIGPCDNPVRPVLTGSGWDFFTCERLNRCKPKGGCLFVKTSVTEHVFDGTIKKSTVVRRNDDEENVDCELNRLRVEIARELVDTTDDIKKRIDGGKGENDYFLTDDDVIEEVMATVEYDDANDGSEGGRAVALQTNTHNVEKDSLTTPVTCKNGGSANDNLTLK